MNEFEVIDKYFVPLTEGQEGALGLKDDAAVLDIPEGVELVVTTDTLNAGTHFMNAELPKHIAHKSLRVSLSDLTAMGATPHSYQLSLAFPEKPNENWLEDFTGALRKDNKEFGVFCSGGDTTSIHGSALSVTVTALGFVPKGKAVRRSGAKPGDHIVLTGAIGTAAIGLKVLQGIIKLDEPSRFLKAYQKPEPRVHMVEAIRNYANAAIDISDGLIADLEHICKASGLAAKIDTTNFKFSEQEKDMLDNKQTSFQDILTSGDDYEILCAVSPENLEAFLKETRKFHPTVQAIGQFAEGAPEVRVLDENQEVMVFYKAGWKHF